MTDYTKLTDAEINAAVAVEVMGWRMERDDPFTLWRRPDGGYVDHPCFRPAADHNDAARMRAEIARQGLEKKFALIMWRKLKPLLDSCHRPMDWLMLDASPREQCIAALQVVEGSK